MKRLPTWKFVRFNWQVSPGGSVEQREVIANAVELVRTERRMIVRQAAAAGGSATECEDR